MDKSSIVAAAISKLEAEKQRRLDEKIAKGEAIRVPPLIVGEPEQVEVARAARLAALRAAVETREVAPGRARRSGLQDGDHLQVGS